MAEALDVRIGFTPDDAEVSRLHQLAFESSDDGVDPWTARLRQHSLTWVGAFDQGALVAFVHVCWDGGCHGFILDTMVHPGHRRQGLGRTVVAAAVQASTAAGCEWLHVDYEPHLADFYLKACGFRSTEAGLLRLAP